MNEKFIEHCNECDMDFKVEEFSGGAGRHEREPIDCPKCSKVVKMRHTNGYFITRVLLDIDE